MAVMRVNLIASILLVCGYDGSIGGSCAIFPSAHYCVASVAGWHCYLLQLQTQQPGICLFLLFTLINFPNQNALILQNYSETYFQSYVPSPSPIIYCVTNIALPAPPVGSGNDRVNGLS